jgi:hypothetical protein
MKTRKIIFTVLAIIAGLSANSQTIEISKKNSSDPSNVCNESTLRYVTSITGWESSYTVAWIGTNAEILSQSTAEAEVKWKATDIENGYIGTIKAQIMNGEQKVAESSIISVTIKSIKHIKPELSPFYAGQWNLNPCSSGSATFDATEIIVPGTGSVNPEKVFIYELVQYIVKHRTHGQRARTVSFRAKLVLPKFFDDARVVGQNQSRSVNRQSAHPMPNVIFRIFIKSLRGNFVQPLERPGVQLGTRLSECTLGHFSNLEITVGNRLKETIKFALYGTFKHDDDDD